MKIPGYYLKDLVKQFKIKLKRRGFLSMLLDTLDASLLGDILTCKEINRAGEGIVRAGYGNKRQDYENKIDI